MLRHHQTGLANVMFVPLIRSIAARVTYLQSSALVAR